MILKWITVLFVAGIFNLAQAAEFIESEAKVKPLFHQCNAAKAAAGDAGFVYVNFLTAEVGPEDGFFFRQK